MPKIKYDPITQDFVWINKTDLINRFNIGDLVGYDDTLSIIIGKYKSGNLKLVNLININKRITSNSFITTQELKVCLENHSYYITSYHKLLKVDPSELEFFSIKETYNRILTFISEK